MVCLRRVFTVILPLVLLSIAFAGPLPAADTSASGGNLLTNPSFEQEATLSDESSLPGWDVWFRRGKDQPLLSAAEAIVIDEPQQAHSGRRFLRIQPQKREIWLRSPKAERYEPGLYEVSVWVRGRPGTVCGCGLSVLGANFGAGFVGLGEQWTKFSMIVYSKGANGPFPWPEQTQLGIVVFAPGERGQVANPVLDIDDVSVTPLASGLADTFGDHMVLQRERPVPVWGWAKAPGQRVVVEFNGQSKSALSDREGRWQVVLAPMKAGGPYVLKLDGRVAAFDVMLGDVWICSGQSNMEFGIDKLNGVFGHAPEVVAQAHHPQIRLWQAPKQFSTVPARTYLLRQSAYPTDFQSRWSLCSPTSVMGGIWGGFSAVGYFFGREIQADQKVAVGLMMIANGGTPIESFISEEGLRGIPREQWTVPPLSETAQDGLKNPPVAKVPDGAVVPSTAYAEQVARHAAAQQGWPDSKAFHYANSAFNGLMSPVFPFAVRGVLWYQGEHNGSDRHYEAKLKALIADWRARFGQDDLPFIIAQLPYWRAAERQCWQLVREAQWNVSKSVPKTAIAVTIDLCDKEGDGYGMSEIHPKRKREVGQRMALAARAVAYGEDLVASGPVYRAMKRDAGSVTLEFDSVGRGLETRAGKLVGFHVAGADRKFVDAEAVIVGRTVVVHSPKVDSPVAVRYGFAQAMLPVPNLYNKEGLPATPFRTDQWPVE